MTNHPEWPTGTANKINEYAEQQLGLSLKPWQINLLRQAEEKPQENEKTAPGKHITVEDDFGERMVILHNPDAPDSLKRIEAGRIVSLFGGKGFQPAPFLAGLFSPATLRDIADLIEQE